MAVSYRKVYIIGNDNTLVCLQFIESFNINRQDDDKVFDKLKGDLVMIAKTIGGTTYEVSIEKHRELFEPSLKPSLENLAELRDSIIEKWIHIHS